MDPSSVHVDADDSIEYLILAEVRELCNISVLDNDYNFSEAECIAVIQALQENTSVKQIGFSMLFLRDYTERSALAAAEYVGRRDDWLDHVGRNARNTAFCPWCNNT